MKKIILVALVLLFVSCGSDVKPVVADSSAVAAPSDSLVAPVDTVK